jgi:peptidoglycan/LPS O-acetylase OafA/YrhL
MERIKGLDQLRFLMAFIVILGHGALPRFENSALRWLIGNSFVGVAAVIVFFILSGFVIHYPYAAGKKKIKIMEFYFRRLSRIIIPAVITIVIYQYTFNLPLGIIWSLVCEAIYYLLYPLVSFFIEKLDLIIGLAFVFSYIGTIGYSIFSDTYNGDFHRLGYFGTWITGLPAWLLGVKLSTLYVEFRREELQPSFKWIAINRITIFFLSSVTSILRFHFDIAYGYTLPIFSLFVFFWLKNELLFYLNKEENKTLAYGGNFSYSIYLIHSLILFFFLHYLDIKMLNIAYSAALILIILLASWIFYVIIEKPSQLLSKSIKFN